MKKERAEIFTCSKKRKTLVVLGLNLKSKIRLQTEIMKRSRRRSFLFSVDAVLLLT